MEKAFWRGHHRLPLLAGRAASSNPLSVVTKPSILCRPSIAYSPFPPSFLIMGLIKEYAAPMSRRLHLATPVPRRNSFHWGRGGEEAVKVYTPLLPVVE